MSDDFIEPVKRALGARVGYLCSNPECRALTSGPQDDPAKFVNVGVAAHITAASPGGPRYDPTLSPEQRSSASNGIWLCQNHAKLIDNDVSRFSVELLRKWKADAEAEARSHVGKGTASAISDLVIREGNLPAYRRSSPAQIDIFSEKTLKNLLQVRDFSPLGTAWRRSLNR